MISVQGSTEFRAHERGCLGYVLGKQESRDQLGVVSLQFCFVSDAAADTVNRQYEI